MTHPVISWTNPNIPQGARWDLAQGITFKLDGNPPAAEVCNINALVRCTRWEFHQTTPVPPDPVTWQCIRGLLRASSVKHLVLRDVRVTAHSQDAFNGIIRDLKPRLLGVEFCGVRLDVLTDLPWSRTPAHRLRSMAITQDHRLQGLRIHIPIARDQLQAVEKMTMRIEGLRRYPRNPTTGTERKTIEHLTVTFDHNIREAPGDGQSHQWEHRLPAASRVTVEVLDVGSADALRYLTRGLCLPEFARVAQKSLAYTVVVQPRGTYAWRSTLARVLWFVAEAVHPGVVANRLSQVSITVDVRGFPSQVNEAPFTLEPVVSDLYLRDEVIQRRDDVLSWVRANQPLFYVAPGESKRSPVAVSPASVRDALKTEQTKVLGYTTLENTQPNKKRRLQLPIDRL